MRSEFYSFSGKLARTFILFLLKHKPRFVYRSLALLLVLSQMASAQDVLMGLTSNGGENGKGTAFSIKTTGTDYTTLFPFADWGRNPNSNLLLGPDGSYYGTTTNGGVYGYGTIYKMSPSGVITLMKSFNLSVDGGYPYGRLTLGADGNLYGTTSGGGTNSAGVIYKITTTGVFTVVRALSGPTDGSNPRGHLVLATDKNFYGITYGGGAYGTGTIFRLTPTGTYTVIKSLNKTTEGGNSYGSLMQAKDGNLYAITYWGGTYNYGTIIKVTLSGTLTVLRHLNAVGDGSYSKGTLIQASDGKLYGMMYSGGTYGNGTIFSISTTGAFTILRHLQSKTDGSYPYGTLYQHSDGALYGLMPSGGAYGGGTAFKITTSKVFTLLKSFTPATEGSVPNAGFIKGADGQLYGVNSELGPNLFGTVFKMTTAGVVTILNTFTGASIGNTPYENLVQGTDNALYGTTAYGGAYNYGTVFKICGGKTTVLKSFNRNADGGVPKGSLIQGTDGYLYGMASDGGANGVGTIFRITTSGSFTVLRHLKGSTDGGYPLGSLVQGKDGYLYGMTSGGGAGSSGVLFKINTSGSVYTVIKSFAYATDGANPEGSLVLHPDGNFYGMTSNSARIFKLTAAGAYSIIKTFSTTADGNAPLGSLTVGADNNLYGTTSSGGTNGKGTIFKVTTAGAYTVLRHLNTTTDGQYPKGNLVLGTDKNLYGVTSTGGAAKGGTLFRITTTGTFTILKSFDLIKDGGAPQGGLIKFKGMTLVANPQSVSTSEDIAKAITLTGTGATTLTYNIVTQPKNGKITGTGAAITYTPTPNYFGRDSFYFTVSVGCLSSVPAKVVVSIASVNDAPVLGTIGSKSVVAGTQLKFTASAKDADFGQTLQFSLVSPPTGALINSGTGLFTWTPATAGTYSIKVRVTDNGSPILYDEETVAVTVTAPLVAGMAAPETQSREQRIAAVLYPNPAHEKLFINFENDPEQSEITVHDLRGTVMGNVQVVRSSHSRIELGIQSLPPGAYVVKISKKDSVEVFRFIKQ